MCGWTRGRRIHIGTYTLPTSTQGIKGEQLGFVEFLPWTEGSHECSSLPFTSGHLVFLAAGECGVNYLAYMSVPMNA